MPSNTHFPVLYRHQEADGVRVFYREAGDPTRPVLLLLHGYPSSSHQFRELIPLLADKFRLIAPDLPSFGFTEVPTGRQYVYTFANLAKTLEAFVDALGLTQYAMYVFDYGAPPSRITGLVSQNGNAYEEGLGDAWAPIREYWADPSQQNRDRIRDAILHLEGTRWQYTDGVPATTMERVAPETYYLDQALMERPGNKEIQLDLYLDYQTNVAMYPQLQKFLRDAKVPTLVIWGKYDPFFTPPGALAFKRDVPHATVELLEIGHFALETHVERIAQQIREVLGGDE